MWVRVRDAAAVALAVATFLLGALSGYSAAEWLLAGTVAGVAVGVGLPYLFGESWRDGGWVLGCAVAIPLMAVALGWGSTGRGTLILGLAVGGALPLAHLIADRHPDHQVAFRLVLASWAVALGAVVTGLGNVLGEGTPVAGTYLLMAGVALVPALGVALAPGSVGASGESVRSFADRLAVVAIGATPGAAMTVLPGYSHTALVFMGWLLILVVWRRFTIAPLLRLTARTERQRDLTVAAVEAERARLAADLHDDALQELTALVRRLDAAGDQEGAELARGVAERLRAICSDLRLPLLDDLGAGPALEWLVARVQPLADGPVRLEREDDERPPSGVELAVFRVAQEALANAVRHGRAPITVRYRVDDAGRVSLSVDDVGPGIEPRAVEEALAAGHLGMANMEQRARQIGALLDIRRWPSGGTHVALEWRPR